MIWNGFTQQSSAVFLNVKHDPFRQNICDGTLLLCFGIRNKGTKTFILNKIVFKCDMVCSIPIKLEGDPLPLSICSKICSGIHLI